MKEYTLLVHGFGKAGKLVAAQAAMYQELEVVQIVDIFDKQATAAEIKDADLKEVDLIIDFSKGDSVFPLLKEVARQNPKTKVAIASSGWQNQFEEINAFVQENNLTVLYAANFAIGTQLFIKIVEFATKTLNLLPELDPALFEIHHAQKLDMPSGTALEIARAIIANNSQKETMLLGFADRAIQPEELHVGCLRQGQNLGAHTVSYDSELESITISQQTKDRVIYADGAIKAGLWLLSQKPGFYNFKDNLLEILQYANK